MSGIRRRVANPSMKATSGSSLISRVVHKSKKPKRRTGLCDLPQHILVLIISFLSTKEAVATSLLSRKWRNLWTLIPSIDFGSDLRSLKGDRVAEWLHIIDKCIVGRKAKALSFKICDELSEHSDSVDSWIFFLVGQGVHHLSLESVNVRYCIPRCFFVCHTLRVIELTNCVMWEYWPAEFSGFPNLEKLDLKSVGLYEYLIQRLVHYSSVMKELRMSRCYGFKKLQVKSLTIQTILLDSMPDVAISAIEKHNPRLISFMVT